MKFTDINFLSFDEAVVAAKQNVGIYYIGLDFVWMNDAQSTARLDVYLINVDAEMPNDVFVECESGELFDIAGDAHCGPLDEAPEESKCIFYARMDTLVGATTSIIGMSSEHVLKELIPGLGDTMNYATEAAFTQAAGAKFLAFWPRASTFLETQGV